MTPPLRLHLLAPPGLLGDGLRLLLRTADVEVGPPAAPVLPSPGALLLADLRCANRTWEAWLPQLTAQPAAARPRCLLLIDSARHWPRVLHPPADALWAVLVGAQTTPDLVAALRSVAQGRRQLPTWVQRGCSDEAHALRALDELSRQVLRLTAHGLTTPAIGAALGLADRRVARYRREALRRLGLSEPVQLTRFALRAGLIDP